MKTIILILIHYLTKIFCSGAEDTSKIFPHEITKSSELTQTTTLTKIPTNNFTILKTPVSTSNPTIFYTTIQTTSITIKKIPTTFQINRGTTIFKTFPKTFSKTIQTTINKSSILTIYSTNSIIINKTSLISINKTPQTTFHKTLPITINKTPLITINKTPPNTINKTPLITINNSTISSFFQSNIKEINTSLLNSDGSYKKSIITDTKLIKTSISETEPTITNVIEETNIYIDTTDFSDKENKNYPWKYTDQDRCIQTEPTKDIIEECTLGNILNDGFTCCYLEIKFKYNYYYACIPVQKNLKKIKKKINEIKGDYYGYKSININCNTAYIKSTLSFLLFLLVL